MTKHAYRAPRVRPQTRSRVRSWTCAYACFTISQLNHRHTPTRALGFWGLSHHPVGPGVHLSHSSRGHSTKMCMLQEAIILSAISDRTPLSPPGSTPTLAVWPLNMICVMVNLQFHVLPLLTAVIFKYITFVCTFLLFPLLLVHSFFSSSQIFRLIHTCKWIRFAL